MLIPNTNQLNYKSGFCSCHFETHTIQFQTISHPCSQNVQCTLHCKISPSGLKWRKVEASTPRNMFRPSLLPGSWAPLLLSLQGKRKSSLDMHETFDYRLTSPRPARGHGEKLLRGMFAAASFARAGKMMGARIQHYWGLWSNVMI